MRRRRCWVAVLALVVALAAGCQLPGPGTGGPYEALATVSGPWSSVGGLAVSDAGVLYVTDPDGHVLWAVQPDGSSTVVAGDGTEGYSGDGGPDTAAQLGRPMRVAIGAGGRVYVTDPGRASVRRIDPDGTIHTVLGTGVPGVSGDGGAATAAQVVRPFGVAVGADGSLFVSDVDGHAVRRVDPDGTVSTWLGVGGTWDDASSMHNGDLTGWPADLTATSWYGDPADSLAVTLFPDACTDVATCDPTGTWIVPVVPGDHEAEQLRSDRFDVVGSLTPPPAGPFAPAPLAPSPVEEAVMPFALASGRFHHLLSGRPDVGAVGEQPSCVFEPIATDDAPASADGTPFAGSQLGGPVTALHVRANGDRYLAVGTTIRAVPRDPGEPRFADVGSCVAGA